MSPAHANRSRPFVAPATSERWRSHRNAGAPVSSDKFEAAAAAAAPTSKQLLLHDDESDVAICRPREPGALPAHFRPNPI